MYYQEWRPQWIQIRVCTVHPGSVVPSLRCWRNVWCCAQPQRTAYCWGRRICFWNTRCVVWRINMREPKKCWNPLCDRPVWKGNVNAPKNRGFVMWVIAKTSSHPCLPISCQVFDVPQIDGVFQIVFSKSMLHTAKHVEASKLQHRSARLDGDSPKAGGGGTGLCG